MIPTTINYNIRIEGENKGVASAAAPATEGVPNAENPLQPAADNTPATEAAVKNQKLVTLAVAGTIAKKALSNVGELTGNEDAQKAINMGFSMAGYAWAFAANPVLAGATLAIDLTAKGVSAYRQIKIDQRQSAELRRRAGFSKRG